MSFLVNYYIRVLRKVQSSFDTDSETIRVLPLPKLLLLLPLVVKVNLQPQWHGQAKIPDANYFVFFGERKQILTFLLMLVVVLKKGNFDAAVVVLWLNWLAHCISNMTDFWRPLIKEPVVWYSCDNSWKTIVNHKDTEDRKKVLRSNI